MTWIERLRGIDRRWYVLGGLGLVIAAVLVVALARGGQADDSAGSIESTTDGVSTTGSATTTSIDTSSTTSTRSTTTSVDPRPVITVDDLPEYTFEFDQDTPAVAARPTPIEPSQDEPPPITIAPPPWAASTGLTEGRHLGTDLGCAEDSSTRALDWFLSTRVGPVLGWDYQHVYPLGDDRFLWVFQDAFLDHSGVITTLGSARFIHNAAMVQEGDCFQLLHGGTSTRPDAFEVGDGSADLRTKWYWPMGGELVDGELWMFWAEMIKDPYDPDPPQGLGWHPERTYLASYDAETLERTSFFLAPNSGATPIYGYAVSSDETHTYLFGNTFEQNMIREGGFWNGPHSATNMWLARVPLGRLAAAPEYRTDDAWSTNPADATPIVSRFFAENPMQPRYLDGQWVSTTAVDGYWGDHLAVDVAPQPWGPWTTVQYSPLLPRNGDPKMNTYHAQPLPWRDGYGSVLITVSNNARNMLRDAWNSPHRYRPTVIFSPYQPTPPPTTTTTTSSTTTTSTTTMPPTTSTSSTTTSSTTTSSTSTSSTTTSSTSTTTSTSSTTTTSVPASSTTSSSTTSTSTTSPSSTTTTTISN